MPISKRTKKQIKDKLEIGLKPDAPYRRNNRPEGASRPATATRRRTSRAAPRRPSR